LDFSDSSLLTMSESPSLHQLPRLMGPTQSADSDNDDASSLISDGGSVATEETADASDATESAHDEATPRAKTRELRPRAERNTASVSVPASDRLRRRSALIEAPWMEGLQDGGEPGYSLAMDTGVVLPAPMRYVFSTATLP
jgi:hypothetical protein